ncbi:small metal-binding protein SmbP [Methylocystis echinoides]|nr:small metal-binding protein SmbP [Methylocystis echinoides]
MMSRRWMILAVGLTLGLGALGGPALAEDNYLQQAIAETTAAIEAGKQGEASSFVEHADDAIDRARSAVWGTPVDPIRKGIKYLRKAVKLAKGTSLDKRIAKATEQAELALQQFQSVK